MRAYSLFALSFIVTACAHSGGSSMEKRTISSKNEIRFHCDSDSQAYGYEYSVYEDKDGKWYYGKSAGISDLEVDGGPFDSKKEALAEAKKSCDKQ